MSIGETIAAVSTPRGTGGVAVIRISGDGVRGVLDGVFTPAGGGSLFDRPARTATYGAVKDAAGATVDRAVATFFEGPNSFTGEDVGEICCHGGVAVTASVLSAVLAAGASQAGPGEFTRRAFINGKMTLTEAEATGLLISADTPERMKLAGAAADGV
ncbi:MAG: tRNA uridine-5-carboxymethylaminomethyl(34) synthesis GTPase MnmE, partial [Clostridia bacterium]|nr:tRNA uridine-5-carboxymethylaminomethyl(34) synthesis GTPase MnmE [Clostridia bacterium]